MIDSENLYKNFLFSLDASVQICKLVCDDNQPADTIILDVTLSYERYTDLIKIDVMGK